MRAVRLTTTSTKRLEHAYPLAQAHSLKLQFTRHLVIRVDSRRCTMCNKGMHVPQSLS